MSADPIKDRQIRLLYGGLPTALAANTLLAAILVYIQQDVVRSERLLFWLALLGTVLLARVGLAIAWLRSGRQAASCAPVWLLRFRSGVIATGMTWGIGAVLLFPSGDVPHQAYLSFVLAGLGAGAISSLAIDRISAFGFLASMLLPLVVRLLIEGNAISLSMGIMAALFLFFVAVNYERAGRSLMENVQLRIEAEAREQALRQSEDTLKKINETLEQRVQQELAELREKDHLLIEQSRLASMGEMISNIAHQWRQPLSVLGLTFQNMRLDYQSGTLDEPTMNHYVDDALNVVNTMSRTIDDFRHYFRPAAEMVEFVLPDAIAQTVTLISASLRQHGIALQTKEACPANGCLLNAQGYPNQFSQVLLNLLTNAKEALVERNVPGGRIEIACSCGGDRATVVIRDNGGGIPAELLPKIFDPYFTTKASGSGIGLYMSKMIMENMGGSIAARNSPDGAEFTLTLPAARDGEKP